MAIATNLSCNNTAGQVYESHVALLTTARAWCSAHKPSECCAYAFTCIKCSATHKPKRA